MCTELQLSLLNCGFNRVGLASCNINNISCKYISHLDSHCVPVFPPKYLNIKALNECRKWNLSQNAYSLVLVLCSNRRPVISLQQSIFCVQNNIYSFQNTKRHLRPSLCCLSSFREDLNFQSSIGILIDELLNFFRITVAVKCGCCIWKW